MQTTPVTSDLVVKTFNRTYGYRGVLFPASVLLNCTVDAFTDPHEGYNDLQDFMDKLDGLKKPTDKLESYSARAILVGCDCNGNRIEFGEVTLAVHKAAASRSPVFRMPLARTLNHYLSDGARISVFFERKNKKSPLKAVILHESFDFSATFEKDLPSKRALRKKRGENTQPKEVSVPKNKNKPVMNADLLREGFEKVTAAFEKALRSGEAEQCLDLYGIPYTKQGDVLTLGGMNFLLGPVTSLFIKIDLQTLKDECLVRPDMTRNPYIRYDDFSGMFDDSYECETQEIMLNMMRVMGVSI